MKQRTTWATLGFLLLTACAACGGSDGDSVSGGNGNGSGGNGAGNPGDGDKGGDGNVDIPQVGKDEVVAIVGWKGKETTLRCTQPAHSGSGGYTTLTTAGQNGSLAALTVACSDPNPSDPDSMHLVSFLYSRAMITTGTFSFSNEHASQTEVDDARAAIRDGQEGFMAGGAQSGQPYEGTLTIEEFETVEGGRVRGSLTVTFGKVGVMTDGVVKSTEEEPASMALVFDLPNKS